MAASGLLLFSIKIFDFSQIFGILQQTNLPPFTFLVSPPLSSSSLRIPRPSSFRWRRWGRRGKMGDRGYIHRRGDGMEPLLCPAGTTARSHLLGEPSYIHRRGDGTELLLCPVGTTVRSRLLGELKKNRRLKHQGRVKRPRSHTLT